MLDLLEHRLKISAAEQIAKDRSGAKITIEGAPQGCDDRGGLRSCLLKPFLLITSVVKVAPIGEWEGINFLFGVVDSGIVYAQSRPIYKKTRIAIQWQVFQPVARNLLLKEVLAKAGKAQIRFAPENGVEIAAITFGIEGRQGATGDDQAVWQLRSDHFGNTEGIPAQGDHRVDPHHIGLVSNQVPLQLADRPEGAIEDPGFDAQLSKWEPQLPPGPRRVDDVPYS